MARLEHMAETHPERFDRYLAIGLSQSESHHRISALRCLGPYAPPERRATVLAHAVDIIIDHPNLSDRLGAVLCSVGPLSADDVAAIGMRLAGATTDFYWRLDGLLGLASAADGEAKSMVLQMAFDHVRAVAGDWESLVRVARSCEPEMAGVVLTEALRWVAGETRAPEYCMHQIIAAWETLAFVGAEDGMASLREAVDTASAVGRTYLLDFLCEAAPLLRRVFGGDGAVALASEVERVCRPGKRSAEARRKKKEPGGKARASGLTVQDGMAEYMQQASGACHIVVREVDDPDAARQALKQFRQDLYESDLFEALDGQFGSRTVRTSATGRRSPPAFRTPTTASRFGSMPKMFSRPGRRWSLASSTSCRCASMQPACRWPKSAGRSSRPRPDGGGQAKCGSSFMNCQSNFGA